MSAVLDTGTFRKRIKNIGYFRKWLFLMNFPDSLEKSGPKMVFIRVLALNHENKPKINIPFCFVLCFCLQNSS